MARRHSTHHIGALRFTTMDLMTSNILFVTLLAFGCGSGFAAGIAFSISAQDIIPVVYISTLHAL
jgi:hypothetical protein